MARDLTFALRALRATPLFTAVTILLLALGIGATTAMFSLVNGVLLRPLPFRDPGRLMIVQETVPEIRERYPVLPANARSIIAWREGCRQACEEFAVLGIAYATLTGEGEPEGLRGANVSTNFFEALGIPPVAGRTFTAGEDVAGRDRVVVLTHALWQRRFGGASVIGRRILLDGQGYDVVGVLPPSPRLPRLEVLSPLYRSAGEPQYFTPLVWSDDQRRSGGDFDYITILRTRPGVTPQQVVDELTPITLSAFSDTTIHPAPLVRPLDDQVVASARRGLWLLLGAVVATLLVACVNVANLLTARWMDRRRELAIRTAMGAGTRTLVRQVVVETACLAVSGGLLGLGGAFALVRGVRAWAPLDIPRIENVSLDPYVLAFAAVLMIGCTFACALLPVWHASRATDPAAVLKAGAHTTTDAALWQRARSALVGGEVALTAALLMIAGLLLASFMRVVTVDPGFEIDRRAAVDFRLPDARYPSAAERVRFIERLLADLGRSSTIQSAGIVQRLPLEGEASVDSFIPDEAKSADRLQSLGNHYFVSPSYFPTLGITLVRGRMLAESDRGRPVALVSQQTAQTLWPGQEPLGKRFSRGRRERWEIVGIVEDARVRGLERAPGLVAYIPYWERSQNSLTLVVRSRADADTVAGELRRTVREIDPELPLLDLRSMDAVVDRALAARRFQLALIAMFAAAGLAIACLGIYAVLSAAVQRRRSELAIRIALGGTPQGIALRVAGQGLTPVLGGLALGIVAAAGIGGVIRSLLFGVSPNEPAVMVGVGAIVLVVGVFAVLEPALRAARTSPASLLRE